MEKLIELLNVYEKDGVNEFETYVERWYCERTYQILSGKWENSNELKPCEIISKRYGFIEWLVENDKIDYENIEEQTKCKNIVGGKEFLDFDIERDFNPYEEVLMWLAIQDEPIEFLISILK